MDYKAFKLYKKVILRENPAEWVRFAENPITRRAYLEIEQIGLQYMMHPQLKEIIA